MDDAAEQWRDTTRLADFSAPATSVLSLSSRHEAQELTTREITATVPEAHLVMLTGQEAGRTWLVTDKGLLLGRTSDSDLIVTDPEVSRRHFAVRRIGAGQYEIEDLGSRNGTLVNGLPVRKGPLRFGDRIVVGCETALLLTPHDQLSELLLHRQRMEALGRLAGDVAHDFNNLLGVIIANVSELISSERILALGEGLEKEALTDLQAAAERAAELTGQLLSFARRRHVEQSPVDLAGLVAELVKLCSRVFGPSIKIEAKVPGPLMVLGDPTRLHQALMNLMVNARDAMSGGGELLLAARVQWGSELLGLPAQHRFVVLTVQDTGTGMDSATRERVFEPFFTTKALGRGTGLGLAHTYGIIKSHGGDVRVSSEPGMGSVFSVYLPLQTSSDLPQPKAPAPQERLEGGKVLVVDDDALVLRSVMRLLASCRFEPVPASDGPAALALLQEGHASFAAVLVDLIMPEMRGDQVYAEIRHRWPELPVVVMSGYSDGSVLQQLESQGAAVLRKPFDRATLERVMGAAARPLAARVRIP